MVRAAISRLEELGVSMTRGLQIADLPAWVDGTSVYVKQSKPDINDFLAQRPNAPVSSFMEIYNGDHFHPENDLFHGIAEGPETTDGDVEYLQRRLNQKHFRRYVLNVFAAHEPRACSNDRAPGGRGRGNVRLSRDPWACRRSLIPSLEVHLEGDA